MSDHAAATDQEVTKIAATSEDNDDDNDSDDDDDFHIVVEDEADGDPQLPQSSLGAILSSIQQRVRYDSLMSARVFLGNAQDQAEAESTTPPALLDPQRWPDETTRQPRKQAFDRLVDRDLPGGGAKWKPPLTVKVVKNSQRNEDDNSIDDSNGNDNREDDAVELTISVHRLADIRYGTESPWQSLDIYFPEPPSLSNSTNNNNGEPESNIRPTATTKQPVYIHIHGGGWSRGGKNSPFYGGPAMCQQATTFGTVTSSTAAATTTTTASTGGCISVAVGYRLGTYPDFVHDAARAIQWVYHHIADLGGDLQNIFLSGHSAGGHIASLLLLRHEEFLAPLGLPSNFVRGLVLVSGVYDLFKPMKTNLVDAKNKWFVLYYVTPAFGIDTDTKREASPLLLLKPDKETSVLGSVARTIQRIGSNGTRKLPSFTTPLNSVRNLTLTNLLPCESSFSSLPIRCGADSTRSPWSGLTDSTRSSTGSAANTDGVDDININNDNNSNDDQKKQSSGTIDAEGAAATQKKEEKMARVLPSTLILNATFDMGLQENGQLMAEAMSDYTDVQYRIIPGTDHASICWNETAAQTISEFVQSKCVHDNHSSSHATMAPKKKRRGKRDKWPRPAQAS